MRKITFLLALLCTYMTFGQTSSDTILVNSSQQNIDYYGDFDFPLTLPDGSESFREITMTVTLGQYDCAPGTQYCHQWDYTTHLELLTATDTLELGRFVTPFATSGWSRFGDDWQQQYVFDVTDFYPLLKNQKTIRLHYEGYSGGFTAEVSFAFVKGTPAREVLGIEQVYYTSATYGDPANPFNNHLSSYSGTAPAGTLSAALKVLVTGHGSDDTEQCCEFSSHYYDLLLDGTQVARKDVWRTDCGVNQLYPQGGTWIYNRSNWCPGSKVIPIVHPLAITDAAGFDLQVQFEDYTGSGNLGSYSYNAILFYYGTTAHNLDAAVTGIVAPTDDKNYFRENPTTGEAVIKVKNASETAITSIDFDYGIAGYPQAQYTWMGQLEAYADTLITLPTLSAFEELVADSIATEQQFQVEITAVNGQTDEVAENNSYQSHFTPASVLPETLILNLQTGSKVANGYLYNSGASDVSWQIVDASGTVVASRTNASVNSTYTDTVHLPATGLYRLELENENCFGLHWWPYDGVGAYNAGYFKLKTLDDDLIPMKGYTYAGTEHDDWGCAYAFSFGTVVNTTGVNRIDKADFVLYPNPAQQWVHLQLKGGLTGTYTLRLVNLQGKTVYTTTVSEGRAQLDVSAYPAGLYMVVLTAKNQHKQVEKLIIK